MNETNLDLEAANVFVARYNNLKAMTNEMAMLIDRLIALHPEDRLIKEELMKEWRKMKL